MSVANSSLVVKPESRKATSILKCFARGVRSKHVYTHKARKEPRVRPRKLFLFCLGTGEPARQGAGAPQARETMAS